MPVQVPTLKRFNAPEPERTPLMEEKVVDKTRGMEMVSNAVERLGQNAINLMEQRENEALDNTATERAVQLDTWYRQRINGYEDPVTKQKVRGVIHNEGDPTAEYAKLDEEAEAKLKELSNTEGLSPKARSRVEKALLNRYNTLYGARLVSEGQQYQQYQAKMHEAAVELAKDGLETAAVLIDDNDPTTFAPFENSLSQIKNERVKYAIKVGQAMPAQEGEKYDYIYKDDDGDVIKLKLSDTVKQKIANDTSSALYDTVNSLIASERLGSAKTLMDTYRPQLDAKHEAKLVEKFEKAEIELKSYELLSKTEDKSYNEQKRLLKAEKDPKVKQKALQLLDANERFKANLAKRDSTEAYNELAVAIHQRMSSTDPEVMPFQNRFELEDAELKLPSGRTVKFSDVVGRVTDPKQLKALYEFVESPDESNDEVKSKIMEMRRNGEFYGMDYPTFAQETVGLSKADKAIAQRMWDQDNRETEAAERAKMNYIREEVYKHYTAAGLVKSDAYGKETKKSIRDRTNFELQATQDAERFPKDMRHSEISELMKERVAQEVIRQKKEKESGIWQSIKERMGWAEPLPEPVEVPPRRSKGQAKQSDRFNKSFMSDETEETKPTAPLKEKKKEYKDLTAAEAKQLEADFRAEKGRASKSLDEIRKFYESR